MSSKQVNTSTNQLKLIALLVVFSIIVGLTLASSHNVYAAYMETQGAGKEVAVWMVLSFIIVIINHFRISWIRKINGGNF